MELSFSSKVDLWNLVYSYGAPLRMPFRCEHVVEIALCPILMWKQPHMFYFPVKFGVALIKILPPLGMFLLMVLFFHSLFSLFCGPFWNKKIWQSIYTQPRAVFRMAMSAREGQSPGVLAAANHEQYQQQAVLSSQRHLVSDQQQQWVQHGTEPNPGDGFVWCPPHVPLLKCNSDAAIFPLLLSQLRHVIQLSWFFCY